MTISKKDMMQSKKGLLQLRGMLEQKRSELGRQMKRMEAIAGAQDPPDWVDEVMEEYARAFDPNRPFHYSRVLGVLRRHKIL